MRGAAQALSVQWPRLRSAGLTGPCECGVNCASPSHLSVSTQGGPCCWSSVDQSVYYVYLCTREVAVNGNGVFAQFSC